MSLSSPLLVVARVLSFRASRDELERLDGGRALALGLAFTWLVGIGRYWDNPRANMLQNLGVGSVVYVFALAGFLWLVLRPLRPACWSYRRLLTFICATSAPAALYAIPIEQFMSSGAARAVNAWFLAIVAVWRLALLFFYLRRLALLRWHEVVVAALLPMTCIIATLTALNLEHATFQIMAGLDDASPHTSAYEVLIFLTMLSVMLFFPLLLAYGALWALRPDDRCAPSAPPGPSSRDTEPPA